MLIPSNCKAILHFFKSDLKSVMIEVGRKAKASLN